MAGPNITVSNAAWIGSASDNACINPTELREWLGIKSYTGLRQFIDATPDFPVPRFGKIGPGSKGARARWRVGDIRVWLTGYRPTPFQLSAYNRGTGNSHKGVVGDDIVYSRHIGHGKRRAVIDGKG